MRLGIRSNGAWELWNELYTTEPVKPIMHRVGGARIYVDGFALPAELSFGDGEPIIMQILETPLMGSMQQGGVERQRTDLSRHVSASQGRSLKEKEDSSGPWGPSILHATQLLIHWVPGGHQSVLQFDFLITLLCFNIILHNIPVTVHLNF